MKTPREILLARHRAAGPKLDTIRQSAVAAVCDRRTATNGSERRSQNVATIIFPAFHQWCEDVFWPYRRIWSGLAATWILIGMVNVSQHDHSTTVRSPSAAEMASFRDQQKVLNELLADRSPPIEADRPKTFSPKPRTEASELINT